MFQLHFRWFAFLMLVISLCWAYGDSALCAQVVDNPGFKALPRPINYNMPLAPAGGAKAVIVYGKRSAYAQKSAEAMRKVIQEWSNLKLEVVDDRTVTSEDTWLLKDEYRKTPMIVLGNAWENRLVYALATRLLAQSNRTWPGGDRYIIRSLFEPFEADVNYLTLEVSTQAGLEGAVAKFAEMVKVKEFTKAPPAFPRVRAIGGVKDKWGVEGGWWKMPSEMPKDLSGSVESIAKAYTGSVVTAGDNFAKAGLGGEIYYYMLGGISERPPDVRPTVTLDEGTIKATAAMWLLGYRAVGGRTETTSAWACNRSSDPTPENGPGSIGSSRWTGRCRRASWRPSRAG
jgi:hypothetical protein